MSEKIDGALQEAIRILFLGLFFFLPLIFWIPNSEVFELPKMYFVYAITTLIAGLWVARMTVRREILVHRTPLDIPILLFLLSQIASTIYSIDPHVSWFGWYGRFNGGLLSTLSYVLLYYALVNNTKSSRAQMESGRGDLLNKIAASPASWRDPRNDITDYKITLIYPLLISSAIVSLYALLQHFGIDRNFWVQDVTNRVFSTLGQPNWLAGYIVALIFIPISRLLNIKFLIFPPAWTSSMRSRAGNFKTIFNLLIFNLLFTVLLFTKSRSGLLGFAVADITFWILIFTKARPFIKRPGLNWIVIHLGIFFLILSTNNPLREFLWSWKFNKIATVAEFIPPSAGLPRNDGAPRKSEFGGTESGDIRKLVWSGALKIARQNPIFGTGPETFGLTYWQARPKEANLTSEWNFLYNKAHNEWLNLAANTGLFGVGSHLLLIVWFAIWILKGPAPQLRGRALLNYAIVAAILGVETVNFFGFSTVTTETYRYLFMGMAVSSSLRGALTTKQSQQDCHSASWRIAMAGVVAVAVFYLLSQIFVFFSADLSYNRGRQFYSAGVVGEAINPLYRAVELAPNEPVFRNELGEALSAAAVSIWTDGGKDQAVKAKDEAVANFKIVSNQSKFNLTFLRTQAQMEFLMREIDPSLTGESLEIAQKAIDLSPTDPRGYYLLGRMYEELGEKTKAQDLYRKAIELKPDYEEAKKKL